MKFILFARDLEYGEHTIKLTNVGSDDGTRTNFAFSHFLIDDEEPVIVEADPSDYQFDDYIQGNKPANLLTLASTTNSSGIQSAASNIYATSTRNNSHITVGNVVEEDNKNWVASDQGGHFDTKSITVGSSDVAAEGASVFGGMVIRSQDSKFSVSSFDADKNYVISFKAKNAGTTSGVKIGASMSNDSLTSESFTDNYGSEGMLLTSEYQEFKGTIQPNSSFSTDAEKHNVVIGVPAGTPANSVVYIDITDNDAVYLAEEAAYDITNEILAETADVFQGGTAELKAQVLNQIGETGYLEQNFSWYVMNTDKTEFMNDFEIVTDSVKNTASITVPETAATGEYAVVAVSDDYSMAKTAVINVVEKPNFDDNVPGNKPANLLTLASTTNSSGIQSAASNIYASSARNNSYITLGNVIEEGNKNWITSDQGGHFDTKSITVGSSDVVAEGASVFGGMVIRSQDNRFSVSSFDSNKNYVISFKAKNAGTTSGVKIGASMSNDSLASESFTDSYGSAGMLLTSEYQEFKGTIQPNSSYSTTAAKHNVVIGVPAGTPANSVVYIDITDNDAVYLAEEAAYDITNVRTDGEGAVIAGSSATYKAEVLNQIGKAGYLAQNFTWYVMDKARTTTVSGFEVTTDESTQTATVKVLNSAASGEYAVVAVSDDYEIVKGASIYVLGSDYYQDYDPSENEKNANLLAVGTNSAAYNIYTASGRNSSNITISRLEDNWVNDGISNHFATKTLTVGSEDVTDVPGGTITGMILKSAENKFTVSSFDTTKSYVFSMKAKNAGSTEGVRVNVGISNDSKASESYTKEYGSEGMLLTSEYQEFKGTIQPNSSYSSASANQLLIIGVPTGTKAGSVVHLDMTAADAFYLAEEQAYDISVTKTSGSDKLSAGQEAVYEASVTNQLGLEGCLKQKFTWLAMNTDRTEIVDDVIITPSADTKTATVTVKDGAAAGEYAVVAVQESYNMAKGAGVEVIEITEKISELELMQDGGYVGLTIGVSDTSADVITFAIAQYAEGELVDIILDDVNVSNGAASTYLGFEDALANGTVVKAFAWDMANMRPISNTDNFVTEITINAE